jgi:hypothetical protein
MSMKVCIHATSSNINTFEVDPKLKVNEFKKTIQDKIPYIKKTSFLNKKTNKYIDDEKSFLENNINNLDELLLILRLSGSYQLQVNVYNNISNQGKYIIITVDGSDTIDEVKQKIIDILGDEYTNKKISLYHNDIHLYDEEMLRNYRINETSVIRCSI